MLLLLLLHTFLYLMVIDDMLYITVRLCIVYYQYMLTYKDRLSYNKYEDNSTGRVSQ